MKNIIDKERNSVKKKYTGLMAEKIEFEAYNMVTDGSLPAGCITIVADLVNGGHNYDVARDQQCLNDPDTTQYWYISDHPIGEDWD